MVKKSDHGLVHKFVFPPYQIRALNNDSIAVAGGGGASKTGVPNRVEVLRLSPVVTRTGQELPNVEVLGGVDTDIEAVMSMDVLSMNKSAFVLTAEGVSCVEYLLTTCSTPHQRDNAERVDTLNSSLEDAHGGQLRNRGDVGSDKGQLPAKDHDTGNQVQLTRVRDLDLHEDAVNVVRLPGTGKYAVVAGPGSKVTVINRCGEGGQGASRGDASRLQICQEFSTSKVGASVAEMDVSNDLKTICTISANPDGRYARLWNLSDGSLITELALTKPVKAPYRFKHCRFSRAPESGSGYLLHTTHHSVVRQRPPSTCYLTVWGCSNPANQQAIHALHTVSIGVDIPSCLAVCDTGRYLGLGTLEGCVHVYQLMDGRIDRVYTLPWAHPIFVTAVEFLPSSRALKGGHDLELVSVSADNMLRWHRKPTRKEYHTNWGQFVLVMFALLLLLIVHMLYINPVF